MTHSDAKDVFSEIAEHNLWDNDESISGAGSTLEITAHMRKKLKELFIELDVSTIVDAPCGDLNWMRHLDYPFKSYIGIDIVPSIIESLRQEKLPHFYHFQTGNIVTDILPRADVLFCRDCLVHLPFLHIQEALRLWQIAGFTYIMTTTFPSVDKNTDCDVGDWRGLNMQKAPFFFPEPEYIIDEIAGCEPPYHDKSIAVWKLSSLKML